MKVRNPKAIHISNQIIKYIIHAYRDGQINLSFSEVNALTSELTKWSKAWLKTGNIIYTSGSRISTVNSELLASRLYFRIKAKVHNFIKYNQINGNHRTYGYEFTVNPSKLTYDGVSKLNRKIIRKIKSNADVALIEKAVEHTYCHDQINVHLHYLVVATRRINQRQTYRKIITIAKKFIGGDINSSRSSSRPYRKVDNWSKAVSYVTKQCGRFPLMMVHHQWRKFMKLSVSQRIGLLVKDFKDGKGVEQHRFYTNSRNPIAKKWHAIRINHRYCQKHGVLVHIQNNKKINAKNKRLTVFDESFDKIPEADHQKPRKPFSRHHYSEKEMLSAYYGNGVYGWTKQPSKIKQINLF